MEGHTNYEYSFLLDRIEEIMNQKNQQMAENEESKKGEMPVSRFMGTTKTTIINFMTLCEQLDREPAHVMEFMKTEMDVEGNFGSDNNVILQGRH